MPYAYRIRWQWSSSSDQYRSPKQYPTNTILNFSPTYWFIFGSICSVNDLLVMYYQKCMLECL
ncbi:unnamed protein product [Trichobilharzia regenti]|nr:unnamed protein product [Trichobilharzia regenti]